MTGERRQTKAADRKGREERLAAALRENLRRRKERVRSEDGAAPVVRPEDKPPRPR